MGLFEYNYDSDTLRAIGHARLHIQAGRGLESLIHALADADLGTVSEALVEPLKRMQEGLPTESVLQELAEKSENKAFRELITSLLLEGDAAISRLEELSVEIQSEKKSKTETYGESLGGTLTMVAIIFLGTFAPIFIKVFEMIPPNALIPSITLPAGFYSAFYVVLAGVLTIAFSTMRYRA